MREICPCCGSGPMVRRFGMCLECLESDNFMGIQENELESYGMLPSEMLLDSYEDLEEEYEFEDEI